MKEQGRWISQTQIELEDSGHAGHPSRILSPLAVEIAWRVCRRLLGANGRIITP